MIGLWLGGLAAASAIIFLRQPSSGRDVLWAEDGGIFLQQALQPGGVNILAPYEGYLHFIPRAAAAITVALTQPAAYALTMNILSCITVALIAGLVFYCAKSLDQRLHVRLAFASIVVFIGAGPLETTGNFANLHWYLLFLTPWLLLKPSGSKREGVLLFVVALATSLTEILSAMFFPLALVRWRDRAFWPARIGLLVGLGMQMIATLTSPRTESKLEPLSAASIATGWFVNGPGTIVYGTNSQLGFAVANFGWTPLIIATLPFIAAFLFVMWKGLPRHRLLAVVFLGGSVLVWVAILVVNPAPFFAYGEFTEAEWRQVWPSRYAVIVSMLVTALLPLVLAVLPSRAVAAPAVVATALIALYLLTLFPSDTVRRNGPDWGVGVEQALEQCQRLDAQSRVDVPIAPVGWPFDQVSVPCSKL